MAGLAAVGDGHVARAEERLRNATFTNGSTDKERVVKLYGDYVRRVEEVLAKSVEFIEEDGEVVVEVLVIVKAAEVDEENLAVVAHALASGDESRDGQ